MVSGSGPDDDRDRHVAADRLPLLVMPGAAAMREPADDGAVATEHLHAVDADILLLVGRGGVRRHGDHERPGDQRRRLPGPADLHRQSGEIDVGPHRDAILHRCRRARARARRQRSAGERKLAEGVPDAVRRSRRAQLGHQLAKLFEAVGRNPHAPRDPLHRSEQIGEERHLRWFAVGPDRLLEQ
jgi:hypothetical protein